MKKINSNNDEIVQRIDYLFLFIIDMINNETDSKILFQNQEIYFEVVESIAQIKLLARKVKEDLEATKRINYTLKNIRSIINANKKHYDGGNS